MPHLELQKLMFIPFSWSFFVCLFSWSIDILFFFLFFFVLFFCSIFFFSSFFLFLIDIHIICEINPSIILRWIKVFLKRSAVLPLPHMVCTGSSGILKKKICSFVCQISLSVSQSVCLYTCLSVCLSVCACKGLGNCYILIPQKCSTDCICLVLVMQQTREKSLSVFVFTWWPALHWLKVSVCVCVCVCVSVCLSVTVLLQQTISIQPC